MANRPISIDFVADVSKFLRETKKVEVSTEDIADALVAASNDAQDLEKKLSRAMRDSEKDVESLERVIKDLPKATDKAADQMDRDFDRMGDDAGEAGREIGDELRGNIGESLASGGSLEDIMRDTLGGLVASMSGPAAAPAVAGAAIAAYLWNAFKNREEEKRAAIQSVFDAMDEATGVINEKARLDQFITDYGGGDLTEGLKKIREEADKLKISVEDYTDLISGRVTPDTRDLYAALKDERDELQRLRAAEIPLTTEQRKRLEVLGGLIAETDKQRDATQQARDAYADYQTILGSDAPTGPRKLSELMAGIRDDAEQTQFILNQIEQQKLSPKKLAIVVTGVDRGNVPIDPFTPKAQ